MDPLNSALSLAMNFLLVLSRESMGMGEWGNGIIIHDYESFPHSLLSTSKIFGGSNFETTKVDTWRREPSRGRGLP